MCEGLSFSTSLPILSIVILLDFSHSNMCDAVFQYGFNLHFLKDEWCWPSFHVLTGHLCIFFGEVSIWICADFWNEVFLLLLNCIHFLCSTWKFFIWNIICTYFSQICGLVFHRLNDFFWRTKVFNFDEI